MAKYGSPSTFLLIDGYNLTGDSFEMATDKETLPLIETQGFGDSWIEQTAPGVYRGTLDHKTFYDDDALASNVALVTQMGTGRVLLAGVEGNTQGKKAIGMTAMQVNYQRTVARADLHRVAAKYMTTGALDEAKIVQILAAQTSNGAGSSGALDNAASSANGGVAYLEVTAVTLSGYTSISVTLQESSDNGVGDAWATVVGCAFTTATARTAQRVEVAAGVTVERYLRALVTLVGTGTSPSITYTVAFARN